MNLPIFNSPDTSNLANLLEQQRKVKPLKRTQLWILISEKNWKALEPTTRVSESTRAMLS